MRKALILLGITLLFGCNKATKPNEQKPLEPALEAVVAVDSIVYLYGIPFNTLAHKVDSSQIKNNVIFNDLFKPYNVSANRLQKAINNASKVFSFRQMKSGVDYNMIYRDSDSGKVADYFVYHHQAHRKLVIELHDSFKAYWYEMPIDTIRRTLYANIDRTLYHSIIEADISYDLGIKLSEVFAWQVDFFKIDKNDFFKVIFDEYQVEGKSFEIGNIRAAEFFHRGDSFYAFNFKQDSIHTYFDEDGKSLRKAFLKAPLKYSRISSRYTKRRFHPVQRRWKAHLGTDYAAPTGTPIRSVGDGTVVASGYSRGNGNYVKVKHNATYTTQYLHMSKIARSAKVGRRVAQGEVIGYVGSTGLATGPHLCFRFWKNGVQVDPFSIKIPPSIPVHESRRADFDAYKATYMQQLEELELAKSTSIKAS